jgi:hypothetical protein
MKPLQLLQELIGGSQRIIRQTSRITSTLLPTRDVGVTDYAFWDKARRGKADGLEISGLLLKPLESKIASWVMGKPPSFKTGNQATDARVNEWFQTNHPLIFNAYENSLGLGDTFLVANADLTLTVMPPHIFKPLVDDRDFTRIIGWRIEETIPHPIEPARQQRTVDTYTARERIRTVTGDGTRRFEERFRNLIGRVPVIHVPNRRSLDETFGRPEGEALLNMLHRYGEVLDAAMDGNKRQGRPTPVISGLGSAQEVKQFWEQQAKRSVQKLPDGTTVVNQYFEFDSDRAVVLGGNAGFNWAAPGSFTGDTQTLLQLLFYLYVQYSEMPEWSLGSAIASSMASANTQVEPLVKFVEKKRALSEFWLIEVVKVVAAYYSLIERGVIVPDTVEVIWSPAAARDGALTLSAIDLGLNQSLIDRETALDKLPLDIDNKAEVLARAEAERQARQDAFDQQVDSRIADAERRAAAAEESESA